MANFNKDVFSSIVGKRKAGSDVTKAIALARGRRGTGIPWVTKDRWKKLGYIKQVGEKLILTAKGVKAKTSQ